MRRFFLTAALAVLVVGPAVAADVRLAKLDAEQLATHRARLEHRLLAVQQRRFEARNRGDAGEVKRMSRKFGSVNANLRGVLVETRRRGES